MIKAWNLAQKINSPYVIKTTVEPRPGNNPFWGPKSWMVAFTRLFRTHPPLLAGFFWQYRPNEIPDKRKNKLIWQSYISSFFEGWKTMLFAFFIKNSFISNWDLIQNNNKLNYQQRVKIKNIINERFAE